VLDDTSPAWWYEEAGRAAGPVTAAALHRLVAEGRLSRAHRVWRNGMAGWMPLGAVAELAPVLEGAPPPLPPPVGDRGGGPAPTLEATTFEEIPVGLTVLLVVVTFGIYGLVKLYQTAKAYEQLAGRGSRFSRDFWLFVGLGVAGLLLANAGLLGVPLGVASVVFQVLAVVEALRVRDEAMRRHGIAAPVTSASTHKLLLVLAIVLSPVLVGLVISVVQAAKWFSDWNAIVGALRGGRTLPA
jgi:hypothetical protein